MLAHEMYESVWKRFHFLGITLEWRWHTCINLSEGCHVSFGRDPGAELLNV